MNRRPYGSHIPNNSLSSRADTAEFAGDIPGGAGEPLGPSSR